MNLHRTVYPTRHTQHAAPWLLLALLLCFSLLTCYRAAAATGYDRLQDLLVSGPTDRDINAFTDFVRDLIAPWNTANLMNPAAQNMYRHTAARK